jgi:RNA polymerase sigma-70 factor (ECF subfamily)
MKNESTLEQEFVSLVRQYERVIYSACTFYVSETSPLEDLYQEIVLSLWKAFPNFRNESQASTWIYRIALNTCISDLRRNAKLRQNVPLSFSEYIVFEQETKSAEIRELYSLIYKLNKIERSIILLWLEEKSYQEIADITGFSVANVATRLKRTKEKLRNMSNQ